MIFNRLLLQHPTIFLISYTHLVCIERISAQPARGAPSQRCVRRCTIPTQAARRRRTCSSCVSRPKLTVTIYLRHLYSLFRSGRLSVSTYWQPLFYSKYYRYRIATLFWTRCVELQHPKHLSRRVLERVRPVPHCIHQRHSSVRSAHGCWTAKRHRLNSGTVGAHADVRPHRHSFITHFT